MKEHILCAANHYDDGFGHPEQPYNIVIGFVVCGRRHSNCEHTFALITAQYDAARMHRLRSTEAKGFLTSKNRFVRRQEAYAIAYAADQIIGPNKGRKTNEIGLTSEDLY